MRKNRNKAVFTLPEREAGRGVEFKISYGGQVLGTLIVSNTGLEWRDKGTKKKGVKYNWQQLKDLLERSYQSKSKKSPASRKDSQEKSPADQ